jgi:uncharacterized membrane protein
MSRFGPNPNGFGNGFGGGFHHPVLAWLLVALFAALLVGLLVVGIILVVRMSRNPRWRPARPAMGAGPGPVDPAFTELRIRYARGEITWDDYAQRAGALGFPVPPATGPGAAPTEEHPPVPPA